jgi:hypothetical protein
MVPVRGNVDPRSSAIWGQGLDVWELYECVHSSGISGVQLSVFIVCVRAW